MEELQVINHNSVDVIDSREVAEMIGKDHRHLIRDIRGYTEILKNTTEPNFGLSDFFIESNYKDSTGRTLPCYLLTRTGCDFIASRMTGKKGRPVFCQICLCLRCHAKADRHGAGGNYASHGKL